MSIQTQFPITFFGPYPELALRPLRFWPCDDAVGSTSVRELVANKPGTTSSVTFGVPGPDSHPAARFSSSYMTLYDATLAGFDLNECTLSCWFRVDADATLTDSQLRVLWLTYGAGTSFIQIQKSNSNNLLIPFRRGGGADINPLVSLTDDDWHHMAVTNSEITNLYSVYIDGSLYGPPVAPNAFAQTLTSIIFGAANTTPQFVWKGDAGRVALFNTSLTVEQVRVLSHGRGNNLAVMFGDSVTAGTGASDQAHCWCNLLAATNGWYFRNAGIGASVLQNSVQNSVAVLGAAVTSNGRDTYETRISVYTPKRVFILYGLNDLRLNDAGFSVTNYENDLREVVDELVADGVLADDIFIGSPPYMDSDFYASYAPWNGGSTVKHQQYVAAAAAVAAAKGTRYKDIYQYMIDNGGDTLISADGIHPNDSGHAAIASAFETVT